MSDKTHTYPREIWLQSGNPEVGEPMLEYKEALADELLTWCASPIEDGDLRYVRGDIADDMLAALRHVVDADTASTPDDHRVCRRCGAVLTMFEPHADDCATGHVEAAIAKAEGKGGGDGE